MAISALELGRRVDALVQLAASGEPFDLAPEMVDGVPAEDRPALAEAFARRAWADGGEPASDRARRLHEWLTGARPAP